MKKALLRGILGIPIGAFICTTISLVISLKHGKLLVIPDMNVSDPLTAYVIQYIASAVVGFVFAASSAIFEIDSWSIAKQTIAHLVIVSVVYLPCAIIAGWITPDLSEIFIFLGVFIFIYFVIWAIQYFTWKKRIERLNKKLQDR